MNSQEALAFLKSYGEFGLSVTQVQERAAQFDPNQVEEKAEVICCALLDQFTNIMLIVFIAVAVVSALLGVGLKHQHQYTNHTAPKDSR